MNTPRAVSSSAPTGNADVPRLSDHLANTRTLLAWIRTAIALIGLGFVVARFGLFLRVLDARGSHSSALGTQLSAAIGVALVLIGVGSAGLSLRRFRLVRAAIESNRVHLGGALEWFAASATVICGVGLAGYLLISR